MKQTVKIPLADLRAFKKSASFIKNNHILPICGYIKFDNGTITKHGNEHGFVTQQANFSGSFLVEEQVLFNYIECAESSDIIFTVSEKLVTMSDGETKQNSATDDIVLFPLCQEPPEKWVDFDDNILRALSAAVNFTKESEHDLRVSHVFIGGKTLTASDGLIAYRKELNFEFPNAAIERSVADRISKMPVGKFAQKENRFFYQTNNLLYGLPKTEAAYMDIEKFFELPKGDRFIVNKNKVYYFNNMCVSNSPLKYAWPTFTVENQKMKITSPNSEYNRDGEKAIDVVGKMTGSFKYDAELMNRLLKSAPDEELTFHQSEHMLYITGDSGFNSLIIELQ